MIFSNLFSRCNSRHLNNISSKNKDFAHTKNTKGITLVALVITVIVLLILAGVTIMTLFGENGLITMAQKAKSETENAQANTIAEIDSLIDELNSILNEDGNNGGESGGGSTPVEPDNPPSPAEPVGPNNKPLVTNNSLKEIDTTQNREVEDTKGNKVVIPKGFKIATDSGSTVQQGIVIEDSSSNQFVWIPVGVVTKDNGTKSNEIKLGRYTFDRTNGNPTEVQLAYTKNADGTYTDNYQNEVVVNSYYKELSTYRKGNDTTENATAKNLKEFVDSVKTKGGYYLARYEASYGSGTTTADYKPLSQPSTANSTSSMQYNQKTLWNFIKQKDASKVCQNMYSDTDSNIGVKSDLVNSYAWDTAIVYIQEMGNANYANQKDGNGTLKDTGSTGDEKCKIYDMAGNVREWTTEYSSATNDSGAIPCLNRGGHYYNSTPFTARRNLIDAATIINFVGFRPLLYVKQH